MTPIKVALVDDHRLVTRSLTAWLESFSDLCVVGVASSGEELIARLAEWQPDVVLQDLLLPGGLDGVETVRAAMAQRPATRVLALTASTDEPRMTAVLRAGASGYIRKDAEPETLVAAIRAVAAGGTYVDPSAGRALMDPRPAGADLTTREVEVLRLVARGRSNHAIADALGVADETVKTHVAHVLAKLGVENRSQAAAEAMRRRLVSLDDLEPTGAPAAVQRRS